MAITFDPDKREWTLRERGLLDATVVFQGRTFQFDDDRADYGERRIVTAGYLGARMVIVGWTPRGGDQHVFSMRKANDREQKRYRKQLG